ncbi:hypothetical protein [Haloarcula mannanilytica]|uniref:hypothetical protein n=1 Tax=Haloarcula mannanilytica TaxID=2509225 RepID=UPI001F2D35BA|nr:hypothetical protein [Haloarcula mannanilytica]
MSFLLVKIATETATPVAYVGAGFVAGVLLIGPAAPLGGAAGLILHDLFHGALGYWTLTSAVWILAFAGLVTWLVGLPRPGNDTGPESIARLGPADTGSVTVAGINATALAAWLVLILGGERFYTAILGFLPGVAVVIVTSVFVVVAGWIARHFDRMPDRTATADSSVSGPGTQERNGSAGPTLAMTVGLLAIGSVWLGGAAALDLLVHDLGLFATVSEFRTFVTGFLGTGSPVAVVGTTVLVGLYRYGELAVLLSAPVAVIVLVGWQQYHQLILASTIRRSSLNSGGTTSD